MKVCSRCKRNLGLDNFNKCSSTKDGYQYYCKECQILYRKSVKKIYLPGSDISVKIS